MAVGQLGRLPVPDRYIAPEAKRYRELAALAARRHRAPEVLVLGNSGAQFGISAQVLRAHLTLGASTRHKPSVLNLGVGGGTPAIHLWLWRRLARSAPPGQTKLLILGIAPLDLIEASPGRDYAVRYLFGAGDALWLLRAGRADDAASLLAYRAFPLYAHAGAVRRFIARRKPMSVFPETPGGGRWWVPVYYRWYQDYRVERFERECLAQLLRAADERGTRTVLVALPVNPVLQRVTAGRWHPQARGAGSHAPPALPRHCTPLYLFNQAVSALAAQHQVPYFDYLTPQHCVRFRYVDPPHLTPQSAARFTRELAQRIQNQLVPATTPARALPAPPAAVESGSASQSR